MPPYRKSKNSSLPAVYLCFTYLDFKFDHQHICQERISPYSLLLFSLRCSICSGRWLSSRQYEFCSLILQNISLDIIPNLLRNIASPEIILLLLPCLKFSQQKSIICFISHYMREIFQTSAILNYLEPLG